MPLVKLQFKPGIVRDVSSYSDAYGWYDSNLIRFRMGLPQSMGGWQKYSNSTFLGTCRSLHNWATVTGENYLGVGTNLKFYVEEGGTYNDITPLRETATLNNPFAAPYSTLNGSISDTATSITVTSGTSFPSQGTIKIDNEIIVYGGKSTNVLTNCLRGQNGTTAASHNNGAAVGSSTIIVTDTASNTQSSDFVTFSGASSLGGNITAALLNTNLQITRIDNNSYTVEVGAFSNSSDTGNGGNPVTAQYEINTGLDTMVGGTGWGAGTWGRSTWGSGTDVTTAGQLRIWFQDNFGEDLVFNVFNGGIYYWDASAGFSARAVTLESLGPDTTIPTIAKQVLVSDKDRHIIAFGCDPGDGVQDPMLIRFSDQENPAVWENLPTNTAGELRLGSGSTIIRAVETKREIAVFTDSAVYSMQYIGPPDTFGVQQIAANTTIIGPLAAVAVDDAVFWMGEKSFFIYDGSVQDLPCPVWDYVFLNMNYNEMDKVFAAHNAQYNEVTWYFPYGTATENSNYVTYNYSEKVWYYGELSRTAWCDVSLKNYPIGAATTGYLYNHELGNDADGEAMNSYIESGAIELDQGDKMMFISRVIADVNFTGSNSSSPAVLMTFMTSDFPGSNIAQTGTATTTRTATSPITQFTPYVDLRLRGRQAVFRIEKNTTGVRFGLGMPRIEVRTDGRR